MAEILVPVPGDQLALFKINRARRLDELIAESEEIIDRALMFAAEWEVRGVIGLFFDCARCACTCHPPRGDQL